MKTIKPLPPIEELRELLHYEPDTGLLRWKIARPRARAGSVAGYINFKGYIMVIINKKFLIGHRLAWALYYNQDPEGVIIDHIDKNRSNNKITNLRLANHRGNKANSGPQRNNKLGVKGICCEKGKFRARIERNGKNYHLGRYDTIEEASNVYCAAAEELYGKFAHEKCKHPEKLTEYACKWISKAIGRPYGAPKLDRNGQFLLVI